MKKLLEVRDCYWCNKPLSRAEYKGYQLTGLSIHHECDKELTKMIRGAGVGQS